MMCIEFSWFRIGQSTLLKTTATCMRFHVLTEVKKSVSVSWVVTTCGLKMEAVRSSETLVSI